MTRFWTCHWQFRSWRADINRIGQPICSCGSNSFAKRGVSVGDTVYIISLSEGQLYLGGRMPVKQIVSKSDAVRLCGEDNLYDAKEWVIDPEQTGTLLHLHRRLAPGLAKLLRFQSKTGPRGLFFVSETELDNQATRGVRELSPASAAIFDRIIEITDRFPRTEQLITVTEELILKKPVQAKNETSRLPEEVVNGSIYGEGSVQRILINRYERDPRAREECLRHYGRKCIVCGFDFAAVYGKIMNGFIHVHHLQPLSSVGIDYEVDPIKDLRPVCPNCHAVIHRREPPLSLEEVRCLRMTRKE